MDAILYAEIYLICIAFTSILLFWPGHSDTKSTVEMWMNRMLSFFLANFLSNFLFTVFNRIWIIGSLQIPLSYLFKTVYYMTLTLGVYSWCGYAESLHRGTAFAGRRPRMLLIVLLGAGVMMPVVNLFTGWMFDFGPGGVYQRHFLFRGLLLFLCACASVCSLRLILFARGKADPYERMHLHVAASFPLSLLVSLFLSGAGVGIPVICVSVMVELQCIYLGTIKHQISLDKLTQINNRQNLIGFVNYKMRNHSGDLCLIMLDLDDFKAINDTYGHLAGDQALVDLAGVLKRSCGSLPGRPYIARYGGDEFIIVMEGTREAAQRLCASINDRLKEISRNSTTYRLAVSCGCACWREGMDHKALIAAADAELYLAKQAKKVGR